MKKLFKNSILIIIILAIGIALGRLWSPQNSDMDKANNSMEPKILYWKAPMDPNYRRDEPGKSPMGMDLVPVYADKTPTKIKEPEILYWKAPMDPNYRRDEPGKSPMGMDLVPVYAEASAGDDAGTVKINPDIISNLGVRTAMAKQSPLARRIETVGYVAYDEDNTYQISTRVAGWVENLTVKANGESVKRGQVLFELYSPELVNAQQEYLSALKSKSNILHKASRQRLAALGVTSGEIKRLEKERTVKQRVRIYAKADGVISHLGIREGAYITPSTQVMSIANLKQVWVLAEVFESQVAWIEKGQQAEVELDYLPGKTWTGTVDYLYPELDPKTRTLSVRLRFDNEAEIFRPNMFTRVRIIGSDTSSVVHIPREALIRGGKLNRVVLALGDGKFKAQEVVPGIEVNDRVEIISGLSSGDRIVTSGQFLIDSESNIESALARLDNMESDMSSDMDSNSVELTQEELRIHDKEVHGIHHELDKDTETGK